MSINKENHNLNSNQEKVIVDDPASSPNHPKGSNVHNTNVHNTKDSYEGRKHEPKIDGPEQASQETDEVYADPRKEENLPAGGKNVADLNANDLSLKNNK